MHPKSLVSCFSKLSRSIDRLGAKRENESSIQMLSPCLHQAVFPSSSGAKTQAKELVDLSRRHLELQNVNVSLPPLHSLREFTRDLIAVPELQGRTIRHHFLNIGKWYTDPLVRQLDQILSATASPVSFDAGAVSLVPGWSRIDRDGNQIAIEHPSEPVVFLDVEVASFSPYPILATAYTCRYWYLWISPEFLAGSPPKSLIPIGNNKIVIGHNVSFDRSRLLEEYSLSNESNNRFICTMSLHTAVSGLSSHQRSEHSKQKKEEESEFECDRAEADQWVAASSLNNLVDCYKLHLKKDLSKEPLKILLNGSARDVESSFASLVAYCRDDTMAACELFGVLWAKFIGKCPHPISLAGILEMGSMYLPTTHDTFNGYLQSAEAKYSESIRRTSTLLQALVEDRLREGLRSDDPWLSFLDWTVTPAAYTKARFKKDGTHAAGGEPRPKGNPFFFEKPAWYKQAYSPRGEFTLTLSSRLTHILLKLTWKGCPIIFSPSHGYVYGVKSGESAAVHGGVRGEKIQVDGYPALAFYRVPHFSEEGANVGSLLTKNYFSAYDTGVLSSSSRHLDQLMRENISISFWKSYKERILNQFLPALSSSSSSSSSRGTGIVPQLAAMGTVTRRAVDRTWMTIGEAKRNLIGSELKSRIRAPPGYCFVGADVDNQELWIASAMGDSQFGWHASTALGWMTLQGNKADKSDLHSRTAAILGISRNDAKIFNYGRIYGAGAKSSAQLLLRHNRNLSEEESKQRVSDLFLATKGKRHKVPALKAMIYRGGSESFMFNFLEAEANSLDPRTPALRASISDSLLKRNVAKDYITSRVNWVVQSSAVDYLHLLLASMAYLIRQYGINARLSISIHDEVRYLCSEQDRWRTAFALQIANLWTRAYFSSMLGMDDLPLSVAFFSQVDIDAVLRKEPSVDCLTPSNEEPVAPGKSYDMYQLLEKVRSLGSGRNLGIAALCSDAEVAAFPARTTQRTDLLRAQAAVASEDDRFPSPDPQAHPPPPPPPPPIENAIWRRIENKQ